LIPVGLLVLACELVAVCELVVVGELGAGCKLVAQGTALLGCRGSSRLADAILDRHEVVVGSTLKDLFRGAGTDQIFQLGC